MRDYMRDDEEDGERGEGLREHRGDVQGVFLDKTSKVILHGRYPALIYARLEA